MAKYSLKCFGVGDGWPCADRNHASFLYRFDKTRLLVDCGESISSSYKASGLSYDAVDQVLISHLHFDHVAGFFMLLQGFWLEGRRKPLPVHLPADGIKSIRRMLNAAFIFDELLKFRLRFVPWRDGKPTSVKNVRVTPFRTSHLETLRQAFQKKYRQSFAAYCFLLEAKGRRVGHSADLGKPEDLAPLLRQPLDLLVCELAHFSPQEIFRQLNGRDIKRVVFVHLGRAYWENLANVRRLAAKMLPEIPHTFARDGEEITF